MPHFWLGVCMSTKSFYKVVGENITNLRKEKRVSQEKLAYGAQLDRTYMGKIEKGIVNPSLKVLKKIARTLKLTVSTLTKGV
mgnify:CR=1 FL=1